MFLAAAIAAQSASLAADPARITIDASEVEGFFGRAFAPLGDLDGDGHEDFLIGEFAAARGTGRARLVDGRSGAPLASKVSNLVAGRRPSELFGIAVAVIGDVDGDGVVDWIAGASGDSTHGFHAGAARVISGATGRVIRELFGENALDEFGASVSGASDVDLDGTPDFVVGSPGTSRRGYAIGRGTVFSGKTFETLHVWGGDAGEDRFGSLVVGLGDVDHDGHGDVAITAPQSLTHRPGYVRVYSGIDGLLIGLYGGGQPGDGFGSAVTSVGDLTGDGKAELAIGARDASEGGAGAGSAQVIAVADGKVLFTWHGDRAGDQFGSSVSQAGDVDGDGVSDIAVGAPAPDRADAGYVAIFSGKSGARIATLRGSQLGEHFGATLALVDARSAEPRLAVGAPWSSAAAALAGRLYLIDPRRDGR